MMRTEHDEARLRRYFLGTSTEHEREAIERDYFERADVLDQVSAAEEELIDDYLSRRLPHAEREQFESHYLATPNHRRRVGVERGIRSASNAARHRGTPASAGSAASARPASSIPRWWAIAASLVLLAGAGTWLLWPQRGENTVAVQTPPAAVPAAEPHRSLDPSRRSSPASPSLQPIVLAVTISPILVRSAAEQPAVTIARGTDIVRLQLRGRAGERLQRGRSVVRTVDGREVWRGPVAPISGSPRELARVDVPASTFRPDDYIVELFGTEAGGREVERYRYFLRVQTP